ncbi:hypothetical protein CRYUN_Cryun17cG0072100 [Craigia yunnanensis]
MPAWWAKKSTKNKEESPQNQSPRGTNIRLIKFSPNKTGAVAVADGGCGGGKKKATAAPPADDNNNNYPKSFDDGGGLVLTTRNSPRASNDFDLVGGGGESSGFSGFDSDSVGKRGIPLPRPSVSSIQGDHVVGLGYGSPSVSSVSSSGSSEDNQIANDPVQFLAYRSYIDPRGQGEIRTNMRSRSPGPGSRGATSPTSPLHNQLCGVSLESPQEIMQEQSHLCLYLLVQAH